MTMTLQKITLNIEMTLIHQFKYILECIQFAMHCHLCLLLSKLYKDGESWTQLLKLLEVNPLTCIQVLILTTIYSFRINCKNR